MSFKALDRLDAQARIDAGIGFDWDSLPPHRTSLGDLPTDAQEIRFCRKQSSHRGIQRFRCLRRLWLYSVNQEFLEELAALPQVESLFIDGLTATDLTPLSKLRDLRRLILIGGTKIQSMQWVSQLPPIDVLLIQNFKQVSDLKPLECLTSLSALGIEGSIWTAMRVESLAPLSRLSGLRYLFLGNLRASDKSLGHLNALTRLEQLVCGALFPDSEFVALSQQLPKLRCSWFDVIARYGSTREGIRAAVGESS